MKNMKSILVGLTLTASFAFAGCGNDAVKEFESVADKVCECKDVACAEKAMKSLEKLKDGKEPSKSDMEKVEKAMGKMMKCMTDLTMKAAGGDK